MLVHIALRPIVHAKAESHAHVACFFQIKKSSLTRGARGYLQPTARETSSRTGNKTASKFRFLARFGPDFLPLGQENSPINTPWPPQPLPQFILGSARRPLGDQNPRSPGCTCVHNATPTKIIYGSDLRTQLESSWLERRNSWSTFFSSSFTIRCHVSP
jgi:hypothetical protein